MISQAWGYMSGHKLRQETFGVDDPKAKTLPDQSTPFSVNEWSYEVGFLQACDPDLPPTTYARSLETRTLDYETCADDPRVTQKLALRVNELGHIEKDVEITYARRPSEKHLVLAQQKRMRMRLMVDMYCAASDTSEDYRHGVICEQKEYEILGLTDRASPCFTFEDIRMHVTDALLNIVEPPSLPSQSPPSINAAAARVLSWSKTYYWDNDQSKRLPFKHSTKWQLVHGSEHIAFSTPHAHAVFDGKIKDDAVYQDAGYTRSDGFWWASAGSHGYGDAALFFAEISHINAMGAQHCVQYDCFALVPVDVTDLLGHKDLVSMLDPYTLKPAKSVDQNEITSEFVFDALGEVRATSTYGTVGGVDQGDQQLGDIRHMQADHLDDIVRSPDTYPS